MRWPQTTQQTPHGVVPAIAPLVISASRATDIPAFHSPWFMRRLREGYCRWDNPYNAKQQQYVSFKKCKAFVFWSKNPAPMLPCLDEIEDRGYQFYFQYTLNDYTAEGLEPRLPPLARRIATFCKLADRVGRHRVIWRFDPIILGAGLTVDSVLERLERLAHQLAPHTEKLVFSFLDLYRKTRTNLKKLNSDFRPPDAEEMQQLAQGIVHINNALPQPLKLATCAEALDLSTLDIVHNKCVDPELLLRLCPHDADLLRLYAAPPAQASLLPLAPPSCPQKSAKDEGQRDPCGCAPSKDIGRYNTCMHLCAYCYANQSVQAAANGMNAADPLDERL